MSKYSIGDIIKKDHEHYIVIGTIHISGVLLNIKSRECRYVISSRLSSSAYTVAMSSPKIYTGPLTQEEIDEIIESYNNSVQAIPDRIMIGDGTDTLPYGYDYSGDLTRGFDIVDFEDRNYGEPPKLSCKHEFVGVQLLMSTVYNCKKCGIKKEDV